VPARQTFTQLLTKSGITVVPVVATGLAARIAEQVGFQALGLGGYAMGAHLATSEPLLSLEDVAMNTRYITRVSSLPLLVDAGAGWGEPMHVAHTVRVLEHAGAGGIHIEDQQFPKRAHYHKGIEHIIPADEMAMKIEAAVNARRDESFLIVARTDAMATDGFEAGVRRGARYAEAGADVVMCFPNNEHEAKRAPAELPDIPLLYVNSDGNRLGRGVFSTEQLASWGWRLVLDAITTTNVTAQAIRDVLTTLHETGCTSLDQDNAKATRKYVEDVIGLDELYELERTTVEH
jgi:2-methylisocitrate lyase-like PEP mutase family enzyme